MRPLWIPNPSYLQLYHPILQKALVGGGGEAGVEDSLGLTHPVLEFLQTLGEEAVLPYDAFYPGGLVLERAEDRMKQVY